MNAIPPGSTIGILGSGQLGRMLAVAAAQLGYRCHIYAPESGPACDIAAAFTQGAYDDAAALAAFAQHCQVVTYEFENIEPAAIDAVAAHAPVAPGRASLETAAHRAREKQLAEECGGVPAPWRRVTSRAELNAALDAVGTPAILKTATEGYDGKGQARIASATDADAAWAAVAGCECVLEAMVAFTHEFSILLVRGADGTSITYPPPHNVHEGGILARSSVPAPDTVVAQAEAAAVLATRLAERLGHVGVLTCEFFATKDGPVFNEMAPRVHNSGHWTIEGAVTSQFENHVRAICGLPLGSTALTGAAVEMTNLIGADADAWPALLAEGDTHLHLYGKHEARPGRKMGHSTRVRR
ncbi:5-(carboxyamino)imidazole ribonucleotide synthase [Sphingomonas sp. BT-65]|uniref:5-(carboxyamino)imidazole ribonucleotide synthase n=1 Tax=Sphingomonas sp. BT-65 TaxID=2989821 RepID=UPI0022358CC4|nr:5-(carboxyamino)imidazole ribonucleotide synthase [Sphingomonas sp. BT-65]MCW4461698.1 5-(carboxyamino)imidazole ribonucleotide synthase [Sphingomonas sp. BT-65]